MMFVVEFVCVRAVKFPNFNKSFSDTLMFMDRLK